MNVRDHVSEVLENEGNSNTLCLMIIIRNQTTRQILGLLSFEADTFEKNDIGYNYNGSHFMTLCVWDCSMTKEFSTYWGPYLR